MSTAVGISFCYELQQLCCSHYLTLEFYLHWTNILKFNSFSKGPCKSPDVALGLETGNIRNSHLTSSSEYRTGLSAQHGRLNGPEAWCARRNVQNQWIQVDLGRKQLVTAIATQGRVNYGQWVKTYTLSYSSDEVTLHNYGKVSHLTNSCLFQF